MAQLTKALLSLTVCFCTVAFPAKAFLRLTEQDEEKTRSFYSLNAFGSV
jgi:hypothetical protein